SEPVRTRIYRSDQGGLPDGLAGTGRVNPSGQQHRTGQPVRPDTTRPGVPAGQATHGQARTGSDNPPGSGGPDGAADEAADTSADRAVCSAPGDMEGDIPSCHPT